MSTWLAIIDAASIWAQLAIVSWLAALWWLHHVKLISEPWPLHGAVFVIHTSLAALLLYLAAPWALPSVPVTFGIVSALATASAPRRM